jgi:hypothetical protein
MEDGSCVVAVRLDGRWLLRSRCEYRRKIVSVQQL